MVKPPKDVPGVDCVCCGVCKIWKPLKEVSPFGLPKLGNDAVVAVLGVTPFCCGWVVWPKVPKDEVLFVLVWVEKRVPEVDGGLKPFCCGAWLALLLLPPNALPKLAPVLLLLPNALPPFCCWPKGRVGSGVPFGWVKGLIGVAPAVKLKLASPPDPPDCVCWRNEPILCGPVGAVGVPALLLRALPLGALRVLAILRLWSAIWSAL